MDSSGRASRQYFVMAQRWSSLLRAAWVRVMDGWREAMRMGRWSSLSGDGKRHRQKQILPLRQAQGKDDNFIWGQVLDE